MKKFALLLVAVFAAAILFPLFPVKAHAAERVLNIYSWEDYIYREEDEDSPDYDKTLADMFADYYYEEHHERIRVEYTTFGTNEIMYNNLKLNPNTYDLLCPSDYMIQKLIAEDLVIPFDDPEKDVPNFAEYGSPYMKKLFKDYGWDKYSIPFTWGTLGFIYDPSHVSDEDVATWECVTNFDFANKTTIKDSVRDTYFLGVALANIDELREKNAAFEDGNLAKESYAAYLDEVFNDTSDETIEKVQGLLMQAKNNAFSLEVDSGKDDIVKGNVWINFAWSGDAVYAIYEADESDDFELRYSVPKEGSNIWFDGWVMPKGADKELASAFLNYMSSPENAILNMEYIGYTTAVAGQEVFDYITENYACEEDENGAMEEGAREADLSYFFGDTIEGDAKLWVSGTNGSFDTQFPSEDVIARCAVMKYFPDEENEKINAMWNRVRAGDITLSVTVIVVVLVIVAVAALVLYLYSKDVFRKPVGKGYKLISTTPPENENE